MSHDSTIAIVLVEHSYLLDIQFHVVELWLPGSSVIKEVHGAISVTIYPGIWRITETSSNTDYTLVQSNTVTYDQSVRDPQDPNTIFACQIFNI